MNQLIKFIEEVRLNSKKYEFDEANTKQALILRPLSLLGWNVFDVDQVMPEYGVTGLRVDYSLRIFDQNKLFIEAKKVSEQLDRHQEQLLNYSFKEGVKLAVLTNGITWWFYLPLNEGNWEQRRFYSINILEQDPKTIAKKFFDFLDYENVKTARSLDTAEKLYKGRLKNKIIKESIPKAWDKIINEKDEFLVEIINDTVEKLCGIRANETDIIKFIESISKNKRERYSSASTKSTNKATEKTYALKSTSHSSNKNLPPNETLCRFSYKGQTYNGMVKNNLLQIDSYGQHKSFSAASIAVSNTSRNGWLDWEIKLPTSTRWILADAWRKRI